MSGFTVLVRALTQSSGETASQVLRAEERANQMEIEIDRDLSSIIARRQPTARDLRLLTARSEERDMGQGLDGGADDYLSKPFSPSVLVARIRSVLRRKARQSLDTAVQIGVLMLDPATMRVTANGAVVKLGPTEFRLLRFLMNHPERVHARAQLLDRVWGDHVFIEERTVDVHVKRLREALATANCASMVETVRGAGYRLARPAVATVGVA